jgi:hypothetical protein
MPKIIYGTAWKKEKVKCLGCSKMIEVSNSKNVCSLKCAEKYTKKYILNMENLDEEQAKNATLQRELEAVKATAENLKKKFVNWTEKFKRKN